MPQYDTQYDMIPTFLVKKVSQTTLKFRTLPKNNQIYVTWINYSFFIKMIYDMLLKSGKERICYTSKLKIKITSFLLKRSNLIGCTTYISCYKTY